MGVSFGKVVEVWYREWGVEDVPDDEEGWETLSSSKLEDEKEEEEPEMSSDTDAEVDVNDPKLASGLDVIVDSLFRRGSIARPEMLLDDDTTEASLFPSNEEEADSGSVFSISSSDSELVISELVAESAPSGSVVDWTDRDGGDVGAEPMSVGEDGINEGLNSLW